MIKSNLRSIAAGVFCLATVLSCSGKKEQQAMRGAQQAQPYKVVVVKEGPAQTFRSYPASLEGMRDVEIRPKIDGFIQEVYVDEGEHVKKGQILFRIRNPQYEQSVRVAKAAIKSAKADVATARIQVTKTKPLVEKGIISDFELKDAELLLKAKEANLAQAQANLVNAQVNQGYTTITSPVEGFVGSLPFRSGSYVSSATQQPLTTVSRISTIYAYFSINEKDQLNFLRHAKGGTVEQKLKNAPAVTLELADGSTYEYKGQLASMSGMVNPETGSFRMRADFKNPDGVLRSGLSGTIKMPTYLENVEIIPQSATYEIQGKTFAFVVGKDNKIVSKQISVEPLPNGQTYAVTSGLKSGDKVVVEGVGVLRDGTQIVPKVTTIDSVLIKPEETK